MKTIVINLMLLAALSVAQAQPGTLDKSYGKGGKVIDKDTLHNEETPVAVQSDGKILVGGSAYYQGIKTFALHRYMPDGSPDLSFGAEGIAYAPFKGMVDPASDGANINGLFIQPDGKIVAAGDASIDYSYDVGLARFNTDGKLDLSFGANGTIQSALGNAEFIRCMTLQPDGKIIVAGEDVSGGTETAEYKFITARYMPDGQLDKSFGDGGKVISSSGINVTSLAVQPDGKILAGGKNWYPIGSDHFFYVERYLPDGSPDKEFGEGGYVATDFGSTNPALINSLVIQPDNKILAAGESRTSSIILPNLTMVRYNNDGTLDETFGKGGTMITLIPKVFTSAKKVLLSGKHIFAAGYGYNSAVNTNADYMVTAYTQDGALDSSFGNNGITLTDMGGDGGDNLNDAALQPDGKIIATGVIEGLIPERGLARYNGYDPGKQPLMVRIKRWLLHHGISWQVQQSKDVRYYAVQRSADGIVYKEIAKLSNKQQVSNYEDASMLAGSSYYRLAAIGWDGSRTYSNTVLIDESAQVKVFPNPVRDNLQLQGLQSGKTSVSIVDLQGNVRSSAVSAGSNYSVNTSQLTPGNYLLKLQHNSTTTTQPFVKE